jgi:hypothetical protein
MTVLDWRSRAHWSYVTRPCRCCGRKTPLVDARGRACHKVCAEREAFR